MLPPGAMSGSVILLEHVGPLPVLQPKAMWLSVVCAAA